LKPDGIYYFKTHTHSTPLAIIPVAGISKVQPSSSQEVEALHLPAHLQGFSLFKISYSTRDFYCAATSKEERDEWVRLARQCLHLKKQQGL